MLKRISRWLDWLDSVLYLLQFDFDLRLFILDQLRFLLICCLLCWFYFIFVFLLFCVLTITGPKAKAEAPIYPNRSLLTFIYKLPFFLTIYLIFTLSIYDIGLRLISFQELIDSLQAHLHISPFLIEVKQVIHRPLNPTDHHLGQHSIGN